MNLSKKALIFSIIAVQLFGGSFVAVSASRYAGLSQTVENFSTQLAISPEQENTLELAQAYTKQMTEQGVFASSSFAQQADPYCGMGQAAFTVWQEQNPGGQLPPACDKFEVVTIETGLNNNEVEFPYSLPFSTGNYMNVFGDIFLMNPDAALPEPARTIIEELPTIPLSPPPPPKDRDVVECENKYKNDMKGRIKCIARSQIGKRERGNNKGDEIEKYFEDAEYNCADLQPGLSWCACFVYWVLYQSGNTNLVNTIMKDMKDKKMYPGLAKQLFQYLQTQSEYGDYTVTTLDKKGLRTEQPTFYPQINLVFFNRCDKTNPLAGHIGLVINNFTLDGKRKIVTIEGNVDDEVVEKTYDYDDLKVKKNSCNKDLLVGFASLGLPSNY